jgi:hypothetical protein
MNAPTIPIMMSPTIPYPPPRIIVLARKPAINPTTSQASKPPGLRAVPRTSVTAAILFSPFQLSKTVKIEKIRFMKLKWIMQKTFFLCSISIYA